MTKYNFIHTLGNPNSQQISLYGDEKFAKNFIFSSFEA